MARSRKTVPIVLPTKPVVSTAEKWSIHIGHIRLFIVGPGEDDWFPCSPANYGKPNHTKDDLRAAQHAVRILNARHRDSLNLDPSIFRDVLSNARKQTAA